MLLNRTRQSFQPSFRPDFLWESQTHINVLKHPVADKSMWTYLHVFGHSVRRDCSSLLHLKTGFCSLFSLQENWMGLYSQGLSLFSLKVHFSLDFNYIFSLQNVFYQGSGKGRLIYISLVALTVEAKEMFLLNYYPPDTSDLWLLV